MSYRPITLDKKPDLEDQIHRLSIASWPEFLRHTNILYWHLLFEQFAEFQLVLCDASQDVIAVGHTLPLVWDESLADLPPDLHTIFVRAKEVVERQQTATALSALAVMVAPAHRRKGHSRTMVQAMADMAAERGLSALIAPVRPTLKASYQLTPFETYLGWTREDGSPFDPWVRVHWRLGAERLKVIPKGVVVTGTIAEWEAWTGLQFPESGSYIVSGALQPVEIDRERDRGCYADPNVWMRHPVGEDRQIRVGD